MAIKHFIPTIWSETLIQKLDNQYVAVSNCNRDYDGDIKGMGSIVKICGVGDITITDYTKNNDMDAPQTLSDTVRELRIDNARCFNFQIDDVDRAQATPKLMEAAMKNAAAALADEADQYVFNMLTEAETEFRFDNPCENDLIEIVLKARQHFFENNVTDFSDVVLEVSPAIASLILKTKTYTDTDNHNSFENGCIGNFLGCKVYVSKNVYSEDGNDYLYDHCIMRTKRAVAFAEQISDIEAYRPEKRFADAVKGLHLYGAAIVYPEEVVKLVLGIPME